MKDKDVEILRCICENHPENLDMFKEAGTWIIFCPECDCTIYSEVSREQVIIDWNNYIISNSTINSNIDLNNEIHESMYRWINNLTVKWNDVNKSAMSNSDMDELTELFSFQLDDLNNRFS